eukprot:12650622-Alexandrium_andersonii.AAC.1
MSASLVGSEMCIRDRVSTCLARQSLQTQLIPQSGGFRLSLDRPAGRPVSYTHLTLPTICSV